MQKIARILAIGGSDCSGGAGIQADLKTATLLSAYCATAVTAVTVQNSKGVLQTNAVSSEVLREQIMAILEDYTPDAIKIGLLPNLSSILSMIRLLDEYDYLHNIVVDPILSSTKGHFETTDSPIDYLEGMRLLCLRADVVTPNLPELAQLLGINYVGDTPVAEKVLELVKEDDAVLLKGGHGKDDIVIDRIIYHDKEGSIIDYPIKHFRIDSRNTHGTGCVLATALACGLAYGHPLAQAASLASQFVAEKLEHSSRIDFCDGYGPVLI